MENFISGTADTTPETGNGGGVQLSPTYGQFLMSLTPANPVARAKLTEQSHSSPDGCREFYGYPEIFDPSVRQNLKGKVVLISTELDEAKADLLLAHRGAYSNALIIPHGTQVPARFDELDVPIFHKTALSSWSEVNWLLMSLAQFADAQDVEAEPRLIDRLGALADALADETGCTITIEDPQSRVVAYSSIQDTDDTIRIQSILQRQVPSQRRSELHASGFFRQVWESEVPVDRPHVHGRPERLVMGVSHGGLPLGTIWAATKSGLFTEPVRESLRIAAQRAAPLLMNWVYQSTAMYRLRERAGAALFTSPEDSAHAERMLEIPQSSQFVVIKLFTDSDHANTLPKLTRFYVERLFPHAFSNFASNGCEAHIAIQIDQHSHQEVFQDARRLVDDVAVHGEHVRAAIGAASSVPGRIFISMSSADTVAASLRRLSSGRAAALTVVEERDVLEGVEVTKLVDSVDRETNQLQQLLEPLHQHDETQGSELVKTLRRYLEHFGNVPEAAKSMNVHANTMRYRIRKIQQLSALDLNGLDTIIAWALALRLDAETES